jgi:hypothetical protein
MVLQEILPQAKQQESPRIGIAMSAFGYAGCGDKRGCLVFCLVLVLSARQPPPDSQISQSRNGF